MRLCALLFTAAGTLGPLSVTLLVIYPLFDVACAVVDLRSARTHDGPVRGLVLPVRFHLLDEREQRLPGRLVHPSSSSRISRPVMRK